LTASGAAVSLTWSSPADVPVPERGAFAFQEPA
jgi:hypothetical protein